MSSRKTNLSESKNYREIAENKNQGAVLPAAAALIFIKLKDSAVQEKDYKRKYGIY